MKNTYNGWSNRETWAINLWFNPETKEDVFCIREQVESEISKLPDYLQDLIMNDINWEELEEQFEET